MAFVELIQDNVQGALKTPQEMQRVHASSCLFGELLEPQKENKFFQ